MQLDEEELNQLRDYIKERRRQYREQAAVYDRASANLATRAKTAASGAPKKMNKREKRRMRAGLGGGGGSRPVTPAVGGAIPRTAAPAVKAPTSGHWNGQRSHAEAHGPKEPESLITQNSFRSMENQARSSDPLPFPHSLNSANLMPR